MHALLRASEIAVAQWPGNFLEDESDDIWGIQYCICSGFSYLIFSGKFEDTLSGICRSSQRLMFEDASQSKGSTADVA